MLFRSGRIYHIFRDILCVIADTLNRFRHKQDIPRTISTALDILFVAKAIERIGDHAKNISEYVVYAANRRAVRHVSVEEIEREGAGDRRVGRLHVVAGDRLDIVGPLSQAG